MVSNDFKATSNWLAAVLLMAACGVYSWLCTAILGFPVLLDPTRIALLFDEASRLLAILQQNNLA